MDAKETLRIEMLPDSELAVAVERESIPSLESDLWQEIRHNGQ